MMYPIKEDVFSMEFNKYFRLYIKSSLDFVDYARFRASDTYIQLDYTSKNYYKKIGGRELPGFGRIEKIKMLMKIRVSLFNTV